MSHSEHSPRKLARFDDRALTDLHDDLIRRRNTPVAHSDASIRQVVIFPRPERDDDPREKWSFGIHTEKLPPAVFPRVTELCQQVAGRVLEAIGKQLESLSSELPTNTTPFDLLTGERFRRSDEELGR